MRWKNYNCERIKDGIRIVSYEPETEEEALRIPSRIGDLPVVEIGANAFAEEGALLSRIEIPPTVRRIGPQAFRMCLNLTELVLHEGLREIGAGALLLTPLSEVRLPDSVTMIECPWELSGIRFLTSGKNPYYTTDGFCLFRTSGGGRELLVALQSDERDSYDVPEGTSAIGESAFSGNEHLTRVALPDSVRTIGEAAFEGCQNLSEIALNEGLREIGANAFGHCIRLKRLHLPSTVEEIGESALSDTFGWSEYFLGLERITVEAGNPRFFADEDALFENAESGHRYLVKYFGGEASYSIPWEVSRILPGALRRAKFYRCEIPLSVHAVGKDAFRECKNLEEIRLAEDGTVLYIPGQPLYRKDEVTALFAEEREAGEPLFDYAGYDDLFSTYLNLPDQCGMACCRLRYPVRLSEERARFYRAFLEDNLSGILTGIAQKQDMEQLVGLAQLGIFNEGNIDESLEILSRSGRTKFTAYLLDFLRGHGADPDYDFSL